jgi:hypothetical protein
VKFGKKRLSFGFIYAVLLSLFTVFVLLDTFVIPRAYSVVVSPAQTAVSSDNGQTVAETDAADSKTWDADGMQDGAVSLPTAHMTTEKFPLPSPNSASTIPVSMWHTWYCPTLHILKRLLQRIRMAENITETTSAISEENNALLAINGDYYGAQRNGYVIRNGVIYRDTVSDASQDVLVIYADGSFGIVAEGDATTSELLKDGAVQVLSFGPALVEDSEIAVSQNEEVDKAKTSNPRTAIGVFDGPALRFSSLPTAARRQRRAFPVPTGLVHAEPRRHHGLQSRTAAVPRRCILRRAVVNNPTTNGKTTRKGA